MIGHELAHIILSQIDEAITMNVLNDLYQIIRLPFECARQTAFSFTVVDENKYNKIRRFQELEADFVGAFLVARACYDVRIAQVTWAKFHLFDSQSNMTNDLRFTTHPDYLTRSSQMEKIFPLLFEERSLAGCSELDSIDPRIKFKDFQEFIFNKTEKLDVVQFETHYRDMLYERSANQ